MPQTLDNNPQRVYIIKMTDTNREEIARYSSYSTKEAATLLQLNDNTIQKLIREGRLNATIVGKKYLISGESLMNFMNIHPEMYSAHTSERSDLIFHLGNAIEELYPLLKKEPGGSMAVMLHQSINLYADDVTLKNILVDIRRQAELKKR